MSKWLELARQRASGHPVPLAAPPAPLPPPVPPSSPTSWLDRARARSEKEGPLSVIDQEIARILALPIHDLTKPRCPDPARYAKTLMNHACPADFKLTPVQIDGAYEYEATGGLLGPQGVGSGKCGCESTEFLDASTGARRSVAEPGQCLVHALDEDMRMVRAGAVAFESGSKECYRLELRSGRWVEMSHDHPVLTDRGWVNMADITCDDLVAVPNKIHSDNACKYTEDSARLCGYMISDGSLAHASCGFVDELEGTLADVERLVIVHGGESTRVAEKSKAFRVNIRGLRPLMREWNLAGVMSKHKRVPAWCWGMPEAHVWAMLGAMFTCDASLIEKNGGINYSTASEPLMRDVHHLLHRVGIHATSRYKLAKCGKKRHDAWVMDIMGKDALALMRGTGPWVGQQDRYDRCLAYHAGMKHNTNVDVVPIGRDQLKEIGDELGYPRRGAHGNRRSGRPRTILRERLGATDGQLVGRESFSAWVHESEYNGKYAWFANGEVRWQRVKSLEPIGIRKVYDLSVPGPHNFVGNGMLLHNTVVTFLCAKVGLQRRGHHRALILVPPEVYSQLTARDLPQARRWLALDAIPFWLVKGDVSHRRATAMQPGPGVWIHSYSSISTKTGYDELLAICATLIICDEAHNLASPTSARTRRWTSALEAIRTLLHEKRLGPDVTAPDVEVVALSGTITKKHVADYAHLARWCLKEKAPVPVRDMAIQVFGMAIDADVEGGMPTDLDRTRMAELVKWAQEQGHDPYANAGPEGITLQEATRAAFQHRLRTAPGVVATTDASVGCSLIIAWAEPQRASLVDSDKQVALMEAVVEDKITPDGDTIEYGMHSYKWLWELSNGFYNSLIWPTPEEVQDLSRQRGKAITMQEATALVDRALQHHDRLQKYHQHLRIFLDGTHQPGCDSPMLVAAEIVRVAEGHAPKFLIPGMLALSYAGAKEVWHEDLPVRRRRPVRVTGYKVEAAVAWARAHLTKGGLMWYHHPEIGRWVHERMTEEGIPHTLAAAGDNEAAYAKGLVVCSYAHATGKNLQHQCCNLIIELRREASVMEQNLGRTHRQGQLADDVRVDVLVANGFDLAVFNAVIRDADYIQSTTGMKQRLCYATYAPVIPPTNPRLLVRLGIMAPGEVARIRDLRAFNPITPNEALSFADVFRSLSYTATP